MHFELDKMGMERNNVGSEANNTGIERKVESLSKANNMGMERTWGLWLPTWNGIIM